MPGLNYPKRATPNLSETHPKPLSASVSFRARQDVPGLGECQSHAKKTPQPLAGFLRALLFSSRQTGATVLFWFSLKTTNKGHQLQKMRFRHHFGSQVFPYH